MNRLVCVIALLLSSAVNADEQAQQIGPYFPQQQSADHLLNNCLSSTMSNLGRQRRNYCHGFISGVEEGLRLTSVLEGKEMPFCAPKNVRSGELAKAFVNYMVSHREELDRPAAKEVYLALKQAFPCKKEG